MLKKQFRIPRKELNALFKKRGVFMRGKMSSLKAVRSNKSISRAAFAVSSDKKKTAVLRNKVRRRMSEIMKELGGNIKPGIDMVFILKIKDKKAPSYKALKDDMIYLLKKTGIYV